MSRLITILNEHAKEGRLTKLTLSSGEEVVGFLFEVEADDDTLLTREDDQANGRWVVIAHITSIQEWTVGD